MSNESFFICECGSTVLALSHTWISRSKVEEVGFAGEDGRYTLGVAKELDRQDIEHEWLAYCGIDSSVFRVWTSLILGLHLFDRLERCRRRIWIQHELRAD